MRRKRGAKSNPYELAILTIALCNLGRSGEARIIFDRLESLMSNEDWTENREEIALLKEAKQLLEGGD